MTHPVIQYWEARYLAGRGSGRGSRGRRANRRAGYVNRLVAREKIRSVIDWGCGDGRVARKIEVPIYIGIDVSAAALKLCEAQKCASGLQVWLLYDGFTPPDLERADLALSLDVIFHLTDDAMYHRYLAMLFASAPLVCIASSNKDEQGWPHVLHRTFLGDVPDGWQIVARPQESAEGEIGYWVFRGGA